MVMRGGAEDILDGAAVRNVQHNYANSVTVARVAILWKVAGGKGCPLVHVERRRRNDQKQRPVRCQKVAQRAQGVRLRLIRWDVIKGEGSQNDVKTAGRELAANVITNKMVISRRIECACLIQHRLRDIRAGNLQAKISEKSSRSTGSAAEVERSTPVAVAANQSRQVAKRQVVCSRKLKRRVRPRALLVFVHILEGA